MTATAHRTLSRNWRTGISLLVAVVAVAGCSSAAGSGNGASGGSGSMSLSIGYLPNVQAGALVAIADKLGLWQKYHLNVKPVRFTDGPTQVEAMAGGQVNVAFLGPGALWLPASGKAVAVAVDSLTTGSDTMIAKKSITSIAGIRGKRVGYAKGTSGQMLLDLALRKAGLTEKDIKPTVLPYPQITTAYLSGTIDVGLPNIGGRQTILARDHDSHTLTTDSDYAPQVVFPQMWVSTSAFLKSHRDALVAFDRVFAAANDYRKTHLAEAEQLASTADMAPLGQEKLQASGTTFLSSAKLNQLQTSGQVYKWMDPLQQLFVQNGQLSKPGVPQQFINTTVLSDAMKPQ